MKKETKIIICEQYSIFS